MLRRSHSKLGLLFNTYEKDGTKMGKGQNPFPYSTQKQPYDVTEQ